MISWNSVSLLGASDYTLPLALILSLWLAAGLAWRLFAFWIGSFLGAVILAILTKLAFYKWRVDYDTLDFTGISGHTLLATAVFPTLAFWLLVRASKSVRYLAIGIGLSIALAVGISRAAIGAHSVLEIVLGHFIGLCVPLISIRLVGPARMPLHHPAWLFTGVLIVTGLSFGR